MLSNDCLECGSAIEGGCCSECGLEAGEAECPECGSAIEGGCCSECGHDMGEKLPRSPWK